MSKNEIYCVVAYFSVTGAVSFHGCGPTLDRVHQLMLIAELDAGELVAFEELNAVEERPRDRAECPVAPEHRSYDFQFSDLALRLLGLKSHF